MSSLYILILETSFDFSPPTLPSTVKCMCTVHAYTYTHAELLLCASKTLKLEVHHSFFYIAV